MNFYNELFQVRRNIYFLTSSLQELENISLFRCNQLTSFKIDKTLEELEHLQLRERVLSILCKKCALA
ncbi:MAG: hypothetical protein AB1782_17555 [Cyanobacteriota bacterium]